jgi:hypothetical protein
LSGEEVVVCILLCVGRFEFAIAMLGGWMPMMCCMGDGGRHPLLSLSLPSVLDLSNSFFDQAFSVCVWVRWTYSLFHCVNILFFLLCERVTLADFRTFGGDAPTCRLVLPSFMCSVAHVAVACRLYVWQTIAFPFSILFSPCLEVERTRPSLKLR